MPKNQKCLMRIAASALAALAAVPSEAAPATPIRDVENPDHSLFMQSASGTLDPPFVNGFLFFSTPSGRRYVIEYVSLTCTTPSSGDVMTQALLGVRQNIPNGSLGFAAPAIVLAARGPAPFGGTIWSGSATVKLFSDPDTFTTGGGQSISMNIFHTDTTVKPTCSGIVSGHSTSL